MLKLWVLEVQMHFLCQGVCLYPSIRFLFLFLLGFA